MRSKEVDLAIKNFENYDKLISIYRPKDVTIENPQDFNKDVETVLNYISELEKETDKLKIEKNNLINERDKLTEEYNKTGEFVNNQIYREKNYISKDTIRDKIKELEEERIKIESSPYDKWDLYKVIGKIEVLKDLLEGE